jgi:hypothetical protein
MASDLFLCCVVGVRGRYRIILSQDLNHDAGRSKICLTVISVSLWESEGNPKHVPGRSTVMTNLNTTFHFLGTRFEPKPYEWT